MKDFDVIVIGGGPAGATCAAYLAMRGHAVCLMDREPGPRHRVGESLLPSMMPILEDFGLLDEVEAQGFARKTGGTFVWGKSREPWDVLFSNNPFLPYPYAYHVDREVFDDLLVRHAERRGVEVRRGWRVEAPLLNGERVRGVTVTPKGEGTLEVRAPFVVDASGPESVLGKQVTERIYDERMRQVAFYRYYRDVKGAEGQRAGHVIIESNPWGWFWFIPMDGKALGDANVGLVSGQEFKDEYRELGLQAFYDRALEHAPLTRELMGADARPVTDMKAIKDWAYTCERTAGPGWFLAGDAAAFLDPLLSSGATMAMLAGYSASVCIHTAILHPEREQAATDFYVANYRRMYEVTRDFLHYFYAGNSQGRSEDMFWKARKVLNLGENVGASQAFCFLVNTLPANPHPALKKQIHMYLQFMDRVEHPVEELEELDGKQRIAGRAFTDELRPEVVPQLNGRLERSWVIDGGSHTLKPVRGLAYDQDRPVFSSTSSWLLGRNLHPLGEAAWQLAGQLDGRSWGELAEAGADEAVLRAMLEENLVVLSA